jgi:type I restriction enzyme M protein
MSHAVPKIDTDFCQGSKSQKEIMASVEVFKSAVLRIRDILRGPGVSITGMDSMRHICLYLLSRYMTRSKVHSLGVPDEFAWENLIETAQTKNGGLQKALDYFYHKEEDSLVNHFDRLFGTEKFSFDVKNPQKHKEILEILNGVKMEDVDCQMDILGWVYEQHLKTGSSAARDLGQFFTDRFICSYMVKLCSPKFKSAGVPESVCDPSMGTGGFLTAYIKYFKEAYPDKPIDWAVQQKEIHGCDTDPKVAGVSRLNLFMESGGRRFENLLTHDSLYGDLPLTGYDVILANMPFGLKGIVHASCCERVKNLKIRGTKSEPLFLQLMMISLKRGGRCAVVVPDGMITNDKKLHNETRKYLLDNFELKKIIKMNGKFFMNTTIQPVILYFENTGHPTTTVDFYEVNLNLKGEYQENKILSVERNKFDSSASFDYRKYKEDKGLITNDSGFKMVKLKDICKVSFGERITQKNNRGTKYPVYGSGSDSFRTDKFNRSGVTCKIGRFAISEASMVMIVSGDYWLMDSGFTVESKDESKMLTEFLWYSLLVDKKRLSTLSTGSCQKNISMDSFYEIEYPCPPLDFQKKVITDMQNVYKRRDEAIRIVNTTEEIALSTFTSHFKS